MCRVLAYLGDCKSLSWFYGIQQAALSNTALPCHRGLVVVQQRTKVRHVDSSFGRSHQDAVSHRRIDSHQLLKTGRVNKIDLVDHDDRIDLALGSG